MTPSTRSLVVRVFLWLGGHELGVLLAVAGIVGGVWMFAEIAGQVINGGTQMLDRKLLLSMRRPDLTPIGPPALQEAARDITALGGVAVLGLLTTITVIFLALDGKKHMALFVCGSVAAGLILSTVLKQAFHRPRPDLVPHGSMVWTASFPSGHSMMSAVTYLVLGALLARSQQRKVMRAFFLLTAAMLTLLVGVSRVYLGVHWPSDVLAGWTAGAVWALICWLVAFRLQHRRALERE